MVRPSRSFLLPPHFPFPLFPTSILRSFVPTPGKIRDEKGGRKGDDDMCIEANVYIFPHLVVKSNKVGRGGEAETAAGIKDHTFLPVRPSLTDGKSELLTLHDPLVNFERAGRVEFTLNISYRLIRRRDDPRNPSFGFEYIRDNLKRRREKRITRIKSLS